MSPVCELCGAASTRQNLVLDRGPGTTWRWVCVRCNMATAQAAARRRYAKRQRRAVITWLVAVALALAALALAVLL